MNERNIIQTDFFDLVTQPTIEPTIVRQKDWKGGGIQCLWPATATSPPDWIYDRDIFISDNVLTVARKLSQPN